MKVIVGTVAVLGLVSLGIGRVNAQVLTGNLLSNPGAETGDLTGWTVGGTSNPGVDNGTFDPGISPHSGSFDFYGRNGVSGTLTQTISLVGNQGLTATGIDTGNATAVLSFWEQGLSQGTPSDDAMVTLTYLDGSNNTLGSSTSGEVDSHNGTWTQFTNTYTVPAGTRTISYQIGFVRHSGSDLDAFVDDNSLVVDARPVAATPEPGSLALFAGMGSTGVLFAWRRRHKRSR